MSNYSFLGNDPAIQKIRELVALVSDTAFNVLITGESGTGKELVARTLHQSSHRRGKRFVKINCAALPLTLLESELFGYEKGAFSGAKRSKPGKFELASDGVIFLDEIADMNLALQAKFLQVLQNGEFTRLGGTRDIKVNTWVIAATNRDLEADIRQGRFREDLYYRINIIRFEVPPLRERTGDIPMLVDHLVNRYGRDYRLDSPAPAVKNLMPLFEVYHWPGNVRELGNILLRLMIGEDPESLRTELIENMTSDNVPLPKWVGSFPGEASVPNEEQRLAVRPLKEIKKEAQDYIERKAIAQALRMNLGNKRRTAEMLGISYKALFYKMHDLGIPLHSPDG